MLTNDVSLSGWSPAAVQCVWWIRINMIRYSISRTCYFAVIFQSNCYSRSVEMFMTTTSRLVQIFRLARDKTQERCLSIRDSPSQRVQLLLEIAGCSAHCTIIGSSGIVTVIIHQADCLITLSEEKITKF